METEDLVSLSKLMEEKWSFFVISWWAKVQLEEGFDEGQLRSLRQVEHLVELNGAHTIKNFEGIIEVLKYEGYIKWIG